VYIYNTVTNTWSSGSSLPSQRYKLAATPGPKNSILALGGSDGTFISNIIFAYDIQTDKWEQLLVTLPEALYDFPAVSVENSVYVLGGLNFSNEPTANVWQMPFMTSVNWLAGPNLPQPEQKFAATMGNNSQIFTIGEKT
jgi:hypothetical protein